MGGGIIQEPAQDGAQATLWKTVISLLWLEHKMGRGHSGKVQKVKALFPISPSPTMSIGLPRWQSSKESTCQCRRLRFNPWVRKIPWGRKWQPTPVFLPGKFHGQRSLVDYSLWGHKESDRTKWLSTMTIKSVVIVLWSVLYFHSNDSFFHSANTLSIYRTGGTLLRFMYLP